MAPKQKKVDDPRQNSIRNVMDLISNVVDLINIISARLTIHEHHVQCLMAEEKAESGKKLPIPALTHATPGSMRYRSSKPTSASPGQGT